MLSWRVTLVAMALAFTVDVVVAVESTPGLLLELRQRLLDAPVTRGDFEQRKTLKGFKNPLVSRGDFWVARDRGVVWRTREPFASTLAVTRDRLVSRQADGSAASQLDARQEPAIRAINEMLFALMATDLDALSQRFFLEGETRGAQGWVLALVPRDAALAQWVSRIELEGDRFVRSVKLLEKLGDSSLIRFTAHKTATVLTSEEAAGFE